MNTGVVSQTLTSLLSELLDGTISEGGPYMLNSGDTGMLGSLDKLSASEASASSHGGATIAAHADHVRYGFSLLGQWSPGTNPWADADWSASWKISSVDDGEWQRIRSALRDEATRCLEMFRERREVNSVELNVMFGTIAHLAYHLGAIRQISVAIRGPKERA